MSDSPGLADALLAGDPAERERLVRAAEAAVLETALSLLGHRREVAAAEVLALVDQVADDRAIRKIARRELHRLRSMGIQTPDISYAAPQEPTQAQAEHQPVAIEAWATDIDPSGSRALWLLTERRLGGVWFSALLVNLPLGLQEMSLVDTTRKRFQHDLEASKRHSGTWVSLPGEYALHLVREAVDLRRGQGGGLPTRYMAFRDVFGEAPGPPERALVYETISPVEANFSPEWLDNSPRLLAEPELAGWHIPAPRELRGRALDVARGRSAGLVLPGHTPEQDALHLLSEAAQQALTPIHRLALRRRLEEMAYVFVSTDRLGAGRLAVAAARALGDSSSAVAADRHPLVRLLLAAGLARLLASEQIGTRRASDVLLESIDRALGQRDAQARALQTGPSGLILPS